MKETYYDHDRPGTQYHRTQARGRGSEIRRDRPDRIASRASQSNGRTENAIGVWQGQLRTIKHYTEAMLKRRIEVDGDVFSWLIPFCIHVTNKYRVGIGQQDGLRQNHRPQMQAPGHGVCRGSMFYT